VRRILYGRSWQSAICRTEGDDNQQQDSRSGRQAGRLMLWIPPMISAAATASQVESNLRSVDSFVVHRDAKCGAVVHGGGIFRSD
jgi:hypothetical protein